MIALLAAAVVSATVSGVVFDDANRNGKRDAGEAGIAGAVVSDQHAVATTGKDGRYTLTPAGSRGPIFVSLPDGWSASGAFWKARPEAGGTADFGLVRRSAATTFTFLHASDTHLDAASLPRLRRLKEIVVEKRPDFVVLTGDLVRDALRVGEDHARPLFELVVSELKSFPVPVFTVPGNHDIFGIERNLSKVAADHPMYGRAMYRHHLGPDYYSFTWGGVRFLGLNSVDADDMSYYGHLDREQLDWVARDLAAAPADQPVVTFNHIPLATSIEGLLGLMEDSPAPSVITIGGHGQFRHVVSNLSDLLQALGTHRLEIALGGHMHASERLVIDTTVGRVRFHQTGAVVGPSDAAGLNFVSGVTLYRVENRRVDDGTFLPLDRP
jgi:predicted phosphodiesterase